MKTIYLQTELSDEFVQQLKEQRVKMDSTYYDFCVRGDEDTEVITPDGRTLFKVIRDVIDPVTNDSASEGFEKAYQRESAAYRGIAAGDNADPHASSVSVGYLDRTARHGVKPCRETSFTLKNAGLFNINAVPYIKAVDDVFRNHMARHWFYQRFAASYSNGWTIGDSCFSTVTVNQNFQTACHTDKGDLKGSFGVLTCFKRGDFTGGELIFPKYRVAVDFRDGDVLLANVHEVHGNAPIIPLGARYLRMSCVFYFRERIMECGTPEQEKDFLNRRETGDPLFGWLLERGEFIPKK